MAITKRTIGLPLENMLIGKVPQELIDFLRQYREKLDSMLKSLVSDLTTIEIGDGSAIIIGDWIYFGDQTTDGTWRVGKDPSSTSWVMQRRESGTYISKGGATA